MILWIQNTQFLGYYTNTISSEEPLQPPCNGSIVFEESTTTHSNGCLNSTDHTHWPIYCKLNKLLNNNKRLNWTICNNMFAYLIGLHMLTGIIAPRIYKWAIAFFFLIHPKARWYLLLSASCKNYVAISNPCCKRITL